MRLISRNVIREITPAFLLSLLAYTFIFVLKSLLSLSEMVVRRGLALSSVGRLLLYTLPHVVVLTIPMALLLGILIGVGRLSGDSELIALRASGVSRLALYRPIFAFALLCFVVVAALAMWGYPAANLRLEKMESEIFASAALERVRPRVFTEIPGERILFVDRLASDQTTYEGVLIQDRANAARQTIVVARQGRFRLEDDRLWFDLTDAVTHSFDPSAPEIYRINRNQTQSMLLREPPRATASGTTIERDVRLQTLAELLATVRKPAAGSATRNRLARVEIQKKFAIPAACLVFAWIGFPLGVTNRRGGKGSGFALSIAIIVGYYVLLNNGETWAQEGRMDPAAAMWLPNALLVLAGAVFFFRKEQERRGIFDRLFRRWSARSRPAPPKSGRVAAAPALFSGVLRFPAGIDRYVLRPFFSALAAIYVSVTFLYVLIDYSDHAQDIVNRRIPGATVLAYYRALLVPIAVQILPFCLMIAVLIALGALSRANEDTAFKACGVPIWRLGAAILVVAFGASAATFWAGEYFLPAANRSAHELLNRIKGRPSRPAESGESAFWILGAGNRIWNYDSFDPRTNFLWRPEIYEFGEDFSLRARTTAASAIWRGSEWTMQNGWRRQFSGAEQTSVTRFEHLSIGGDDRPRLFSREHQTPGEMRYRELARYTERLERSGYPASALSTALAGKIAGAFQPFVLALLGIPFAFSIGRRGTLTGIGAGLACGMLFLILAAFSTKMGEVGSLPPVLAAWSPNLIVVLFAGFRMTRTQT